MHAISYQQNTGLTPVAMINRNQPGAADKHEQIRDAVRAWAASLDMGVSVAIYRSKKWLAAVGQIERCVLCGAWGTQVAHRNEGKGMGLKTDDCATAALCVCCHDSIDNGNKLNRDERRQLMDRAIVLTVIEVARRGLVVPA
ncbi:regulatory protein CII [Enterobacter hormaechei]|uniref:Regulatory protein CII n=3 Tax=Enterobacter TaxID=547 RepID=A0A822WMZ8_9ENTR|nr:regulatory protein CII [Enterobacter hormaechei]